ncbi:MAG TPA: hypothetical protein VFZ58_05040 [Candidatus Saccharimonadales bacterium]
MLVTVRRFGRIIGLVCAALLALVIAEVCNWHGFEYSLWYTLIASILLCFGLYKAVADINHDELRRYWRIVLIAVTLGVFLKYLFIFTVAYLATYQWQYAVLAMVVAQIDPLQVAALNKNKHMGDGAKTYLNAWAALDDPATTIATPVILSLASITAGHDLVGNDTWRGTITPLLVLGLLLLAVAATMLWRRLRGSSKPVRGRIVLSERTKIILVCAVLSVSAFTGLFGLVVIAGWFIRPAWLTNGRRADFLLNLALYGAIFLLGLLLAGGVDVRGGIILGLATYLSQIVVAWIVRWVALLVSQTERAGTRFSRRDTWYLAFSQQNGITAIVLVLNLEPFIPGSVAVVSLAIVVINIANFGCNSVRGWVMNRRTKEAQ